MRIGIVAPGTRIDPATADKVRGLAARLSPAAPPELIFHKQCFLSAGHFAGDDAARAAAFLEFANDPAFDAIWFARGGYGACRFAGEAVAQLKPAAREKTYLGYSDAGSLLAALHRRGFPNVAHGPMPVDITRPGGEAALARALSWLTDRKAEALEPSLTRGAKHAAFNIMILSALIGTEIEPDLSGHVLMLEEVGEYMYRIDRALFHILSQKQMRGLAGVRLGRCSLIPANDPDFVRTEEEVVRDWCARAGIAYLGRADIGHDVANKIVPFGALA